MAFELAPLPYAADALEPFIDKQTMEIHHDKHHQAYVTNLNNAVNGTEMAGHNIEDLLKSVGKAPVAVRNNGGGHWNHTFFWNSLHKNEGGKPNGALAQAIDSKFGSFDAFKEEFAKAATTRFGSGWAWLIVGADGALAVTSTPNQDNPLMVSGIPILGNDLWEHAYYLTYQNRRAEYLAQWWNVVNWNAVNDRYKKAIA